MGIKKECVDRILERSETDPLDLVNIITSFSSEPRREGASWKTACPLCGADHALVITPGRRVFKMTPLHHHFQKEGIDAIIKRPARAIPEAKIVVRFWIVSILLAVITIITLKIR